MTTLPTHTDKALGLVIDLDICVGCHACVVNCKEWNTGGYGAPLSDQNPYGADPSGSWLNRIHTFEVDASNWEGGSGCSGSQGQQIPGTKDARVVHFPKSCLHCEDAPCVTVCPTGASYKRSEDGIVLVNEDWCIGCGLCAWSCPYGAREMDAAEGVMKKCTLCVDRIYNENLPEVDREPACVRTCPANARHFGDFSDPNSEVSIMVAARGGMDLMPEQGTRPVNKYLPPRPKTAPVQSAADRSAAGNLAALAEPEAGGFLGWLDAALERMG
jgi:Fe-S-cluster-containing dehydrogenase component